ncbi:Uncharacterised protein r2_g4068 [Pycnogonum litorale]
MAFGTMSKFRQVDRWLVVLVVIHLLVQSGVTTSGCPDTCQCTTRRVNCDRGGMTRIPTENMDPNIEVLNISKGTEGPKNKLTIGRIFRRFEYMKELRMTYSNIPAIGENTFAGLYNLRVLDLSHNRIKQLRHNEFVGVETLEAIHLDDNLISSTPSAPFCNLTKLRTLTLARNELIILAPRMFHCLDSLKKLDLSGNSLTRIDPQVFNDLRPLRYLYLRRCGLKRIHSLVYQMLSNLLELDLGENLFTTFVPSEFSVLENLERLLLDGNRISVLQEQTFGGLRLNFLGLSNNNLDAILRYAFSGLVVRTLDISRNNFKSFNWPYVLGPVMSGLRGLYIGDTDISIDVIKDFLKALPELREFSLKDSNFVTIPTDLFADQRSMQLLDISGNLFATIHPDILDPLDNLRVLDISNNLLPGIEKRLIDKIQSLNRIRKVILRGNPLRCDLCNIPSTLRWMNTSKIFFCKDCTSGPDYCARCVYPKRLAGRDIKNLRSEELRYCAYPDSQASVLTTESQVGIFIAVAICILIMTVIVVIVLMYQRQGAYYTREDERSDIHIDEATFYDHNLADDIPINGKSAASDKKSIRSGSERIIDDNNRFHHSNSLKH